MHNQKCIILVQLTRQFSE